MLPRINDKIKINKKNKKLRIKNLKQKSYIKQQYDYKIYNNIYMFLIYYKLMFFKGSSYLFTESHKLKIEQNEKKLSLKPL